QQVGGFKQSLLGFPANVAEHRNLPRRAGVFGEPTEFGLIRRRSRASNRKRPRAHTSSIQQTAGLEQVFDSLLWLEPADENHAERIGPWAAINVLRNRDAVGNDLDPPHAHPAGRLARL